MAPGFGLSGTGSCPSKKAGLPSNDLELFSAALATARSSTLKDDGEVLTRCFYCGGENVNGCHAAMAGPKKV
jgi:hypothetical protein